MELKSIGPTILNIAYEAIIVIEEDQKIIFFNQGAERIFGYHAPEVLGQPLDILLPLPLSEIHRSHVRGFAASAVTVRRMDERLEITGRRKDGAIFPAEASIAKVPNGEQTVFAVIMRDVTERKQAEQKLRESEKRYRSALEGMLEGVQIIGYNWRYLFVNDTAASHGKRQKEELLGYTIMECYPGIEKTAMFAALRRCMAERTSHSMENEFMYPDGSKSWFELSIQPTQEGLLVLSSDVTGRKQAEQCIETELRRLSALSAIDSAIIGCFDLPIVLNDILEHATTQLDIDAASVLLLNPDTQTLTYAAGRGFRTRAIEQTRVRLGEGISSKSILDRQVVHLLDPAHTADFTRAALLEGESFVEYYGAPITGKDHIIGVLEVFNRAPHETSEDWRSFLQTLAGQTAVAVDNVHLFENLQRSNSDLSTAYDATIEGWSHALDLRDKETEGHTQRVTLLTEHLARLMGISEAELVHIRRGALLHDIGKMGVPDSILHKPGPLTEEEWVLMRRHPRYAYEMLSPIAFLHPALDIPYYHHEKWDGSGYPLGLRGENIPLAARIFAVVDVWDALSSDRPYRPAWSPEQVQQYLREQAGRHFDPAVVETFQQLDPAQILYASGAAREGLNGGGGIV
ncbi:MAG: PAS domain S-box protein [Chloroflexi bacterium]|nr:PAS domain S-box protein [Chloroflexota bacterium]MCL5275669.1 PAS domain S-box protein [Chloroflexota bacterium]